MTNHNKAWRRFTRSCWQLLIPALLGLGLGVSGLWAAALAALGPGMGRGAARASRLSLPTWKGALTEGLAAATLAVLVAASCAVWGALAALWIYLSARRGYQAAATMPRQEGLSLARVSL